MVSFDFVPAVTAEVTESLPTGASDHEAETKASAEERRVSHRRLGTRLRSARKHAGLSQTAVAQMFRLSYQQWQKYESGENRISAVTLHMFAGILNIDVGWFLAALDDEVVMRSAAQVASRDDQAERVVALLNGVCLPTS
jgi:transcriptional regulator with XRE-family HTH domain